MSERGKRRAAWQRKMLKIYGPGERCQSCGTTEQPIDNAHRLKKTKIVSEDEYVHGRAHLCRREHTALDEARGEHTHERMFIFITGLMSRSGVEIDTPEGQEMRDRIGRLEL